MNVHNGEFVHSLLPLVTAWVSTAQKFILNLIYIKLIVLTFWFPPAS